MEEKEFDIQEELKKLPKKPGVYLMHDEKDEIIYVGKAISLKNRVRQYFQSSRNKTAKIEQMVSRIHHFEYIITDSELEALVLECNLIKEYQPRYNTMLKDDKTYPYIKVTINEAFPRIFFAREMKKDKCKYFGPYTNGGAIKDILELLQKIYKIRTCNRVLPRDIGKDRPCLNYHMKQCDAPCQGLIGEEAYQESIQKALNFLDGNYEEIAKELKQKMLAASEALEYEEAREYRDLLGSVKQIAQKQKITSNEMEDRDVIAFAQEEMDAVVQVFFIRDGKLIGREHFHLTVAPQESREQIMTSFIKQYYSGTPFIPKELMLQEKVEEPEILTEWLSGKRGQKVFIRVPKKGQKEKLVDLAARNAQMVLEQDKEKIKREELRTRGAVQQIEEWLGIKGIVRMEAFDISNTNGFESVGSMIVYENGKPKRSDYRKFRIKTVIGADDYASMKEVLTRRFEHGIFELQTEGKTQEMGSFTRFPDLIMMDGGRGQVNVCLAVLEQLQLKIPVCGMVKDENHRTRGLYFNNIEIPIDKSSEGFRLITRIQDEAHRFAIEYHRSLHRKGQVHSILEDIKGIGPARRKALMQKFRDIESIRTATIEELKVVETMNEKAARQVYQFFHPSE